MKKVSCEDETFNGPSKTPRNQHTKTQSNPKKKNRNTKSYYLNAMSKQTQNEQSRD